MTRRLPQALALLVGVGALVGCDHATKALALSTLQHHAAVVVVPGVIDLGYTENRDIAFSALSRLSLHAPAWSLALFALVAMLAITAAWLRRPHRPWSQHAGFAMIVADVLIVAGGILLALPQVGTRIGARAQARTEPPAQP